MSTGTALPWAEAAVIAKDLHDSLTPVCEKVKVCGSLRRRRAQVSDIEILCAPQTRVVDLLGEEAYDFASILQVARSWGDVTLGASLADRADYAPRQLKIENVRGVAGLKCDVFICHPPANWFVLLAIRTGPAALGKLAVTRMKAFGLRCEDARILDGGREYEVRDEFDFFQAARLPYLKPFMRDTDDAFRPLPASDGARDLLRKACEE